MGGGQDRHVIQMIANASLDVIEEVMRKDNAMFVLSHMVFCMSLHAEFYAHKVFKICRQVQ
jgi:hypothetical protein